MQLALNVSTSDLATVGPRLVGLTFVWAGVIKAVAPHTFYAHLQGLGWIDRRWIQYAVTLAAALEVGWGVALTLDTSSAVLYPLTIALLLALSTISWWGVRVGRTTDCGCYGGFVQPSIYQSLALNATFIALIAASWTSRPISPTAHLWKAAAILAGVLAAGIIAAYAQHFERRHSRLLFDTNPLKAGRRWRHGWAGGLTKNIDGETIVAFLGPDCPFCAQWVRIGNAVIQSPSLPKVIGVVAASRSRRDAFVHENGIKFPVAMISQSLMGRLAQAVPTSVLVKSGIIQKTWIGSAPPPEFVDSLRNAFFPNAASQQVRSSSVLANG